MKKYIFILLLLFTVCFYPAPYVIAASDDNGNLIDDAVYYNRFSMNEQQIGNFINSFAASCLITTNMPNNLSSVTWKEPLGYSSYGENVTAARVIWKSSQLYSINPQVLLATLEKEQNLVTGKTGCATWRYNSAMGYNCPDGSENSLKDYPSIGVNQTCVAKESNVTFSRQVNRAAWQLSFDGKRSNGDLDWMSDGATWYYGRMTQGNRARSAGQYAIYYDGYTSIDGQTIYLANGPTAALYNYTPHFNNFRSIFRNWFGSTTGPDNYWAVNNLDISLNSDFSQQARTNGSEIFLEPNQKAYVRVTAQNLGRTTWQRESTRLGTYNPMDYPSLFADNSWLARYRIVRMSETSVAPFQNAHFEFTITAPSQANFYTEKYNLVNEGVTWFNDANLRLYVTVLANGDSPLSSIPSQLSVNNQFIKNDILQSGSTNSTLTLSKSGNLEIYTALQKKWESNTSSSGATKLVLQSDGNLVLYTSNNAPVWSSGTNIGDQTNLVNRRLPDRGRLYAGQNIITPNRQYRLSFQADGNIVLYNSSLRALWSTNTYQSKAKYLEMQPDGNLVLYDENDRALWSSGTSAYGTSDLVLQQDGNLVLYNTALNATWSSSTYSK